MNVAVRSQSPAMDLTSLYEMTTGFMPNRIVTSAVQLGIFWHLASGPCTSEVAAASLAISPRGARMLMEALVSLGLLAKQDGMYSLTAVAEEYLVPSSPSYMGGVMEGDFLWNAWARLPEVIRTGRPVDDLSVEEEGQKFFPTLVRMLHVIQGDSARLAASDIARRLSAMRRKTPRVLDVACGSGIWGISVAQALPSVRVVAQDYPAMLDITSDYARREGVLQRFQFLGGDLKAMDFGESLYHAAILGNIVHSEGEASSRDLFARLHRALCPGGCVAIVDMIPNSERTAPLFPLAFALNMLLHTAHGDTYTLAEYTQWLKEAGFSIVETVDIASHSPMVVATRSL